MLRRTRRIASAACLLVAIILLVGLASVACADVPYVVGPDGTRHYLGALPLDRGQMDPRRVMSPQSLARAAAFPMTASADNSAGLPPVGNQGTQGSCTAWATGYYMKTYLEGQEGTINPATAQISPAFIYNQTNSGGDTGGWSYRAMDLIADKGACLLADMPYNASDATTFPNRAQFEAALPYRGLGGGAFFFTEQGGGLAAIDAMKAYLDAGNVFVIEIPVYYDSFTTLSGPEWIIEPPVPGDLEAGGHAICVCGYDDDKQNNDGTVVGGFKFVNSWDTTWGDSGYAWLSYDFVRTYAFDACYMTDRTGYTPSHAAWIEIDHPERSDLYVAVGVAPTTSPAWYMQVFDALSFGDGVYTGSGQPNYHAMQDLTDAAAYLPPNPPGVDCEQWFVKASDDGRHNTGTIESLEIEYLPGGVGPWTTTASPVAIPDEHSVPVYMTLFAGLGPDIDVSTTVLDLGTITGVTTDNTTVQVQNLGGYPCDWTLTESVAWLTVSPDSGSLPAYGSEQLAITVDPTGLSAGAPYHYSDTFTITRDDNPSDTVDVTVQFDYPPDLAVNTNTVDLGSLTHPTNDISVYVYNTGGDTLDWTLTENVSWLTVAPTSGTGVGAGAQDWLTVTVDPTGCTDGLHYSDTFEVARDSDPTDKETITVEFTYYQDLLVPANYTTIQQAIDRSADGDTIWVSPGTYNENIDFKGKNVEVWSTSGAASTIIDGGDAGSVVTFNSGETDAAALRGFTVQNGSAQRGGGIYINNASPIIESNLIRDNQVGLDGGGVYVTGGSPWLIGNSIQDGNAATSGGGVCLDNADATLEYNEIHGNSADLGGGVCAVGSAFTIRGCNIHGNNALAKGGGLFMIYASAPQMEANLVMGNSAATYGGGIYCGTACSLALTNATVVGNDAASGGGVYVENASPTINSSIVAFNLTGGGIFGAAATPTITYSNVFGNLYGGSGGDYVGIADATGNNGNIKSDPLFADAANSDYHLLSREGRWDPVAAAWVDTDTVSSPSIDAGDPALAFNVEPAPNGGVRNQGAFGNTDQASKTPCVVSITAGPAGDPNPVNSRNNVQCSVTANDTNGHALTYVWQAVDEEGDPAGSFDDNTAQNPIWTAPINSSEQVHEYTLSVTVTCSDGGTASGSYTQEVAPVSDQVIITTGPSGTPNPVPSESEMQCDVAATDTMGHALTYAWEAEDAGGTAAGSFDDATDRNPIWTAPINDTGGDVDYTVTVTVTCSQGKQDTGSFVATVQPSAHTLTITDGPSGTPNGVASEGQVQCTVTAVDSDPANVPTYLWQATDDQGAAAGAFDDNTLQEPVWTAPPNTSWENAEYTITVTVTSGGLVRTGSYMQIVTPVPPAMPTNLAAAIGADGASVDLSWTDNSTNEEEFAIRRRIMHSDGSWDDADWKVIGWVPANTTIYNDSDVTDPNTYEYAVRSSNPGAPSNWTAGVTIELVSSIPSAPTQLSATEQSLGGGNWAVILTWTDNSDNEAGFLLQRRLRQADGSWPEAWDAVATIDPNATTYTDDTVAADNEYQYRLRSFNAVGDSDWSASAAAATVSLAPQAPTDLQATVTAGLDIELDWTDNADNESSYLVQRRKVRDDGTWSDSDWATLSSLAPNSITYLDTTPLYGPVYQYRVRAANALGASNWDTTAGVAVVTQAPDAPGGLTVQSDANNHVQLTWDDKANDELGFDVERRKQNADGTWPAAWTALPQLGPNLETYTDDSLTAAGSYQYRLRAYNSAGSSTWAGPAQISATPPRPAEPSNLTITAVNNSSDIRVAWQDNSNNETGFGVQRRRWLVDETWSDWTTVLWSAPNLTQFVDQDIPVGSSYQYRLHAVNFVGPSEWVVSYGIRCEPTPIWPNNLAAVTVNSGQDVKVTWTDRSQVENNLKVQRRDQLDDDSWGNWTTIVWLGANVTQYTDDNIATDGQYEYRVQLFNAAGGSELTLPVSVWRLTSVPQAPTDIAATLLPGDQVQVDWTDNADNESAYALQRRKARADGTWSAADWRTLAGSLPRNSATYLDTTVTYGAVYQYRVRASNALGSSDWNTTPTSINIVTEPPEAPSGLAVQVDANNHVRLTWDDMASVEVGFDVQRRKTDTEGTWPWTTIVQLGPNTESYTDDTLTEAGSYEYRVRAYNSAGASAWATPVTVSAVPPAPAAPSNLTVQAVNDSTDIRATWQDNSSNETGFTLQRRRWLVTGAWSDWTTVVTTVPDQTEFLDDQIPVGSSYQYRVRAVNAVEPSGWAVSFGTRCEPTPLWPDNLQAEVTNPGQDIKLTWTDKSQKENRIEVQRRDQRADGQWQDWATIALLAANVTEFIDDTIPGDGQYQYRVRMLNAVGASEWPLPVSIWRVGSVPQAPTGITAALQPGDQVQLNWNDNADNEAAYVLQRRQAHADGTWSDADWATLDTLAQNSEAYLDTTAVHGAVYQYRVRAYNEAGASDWNTSAAVATVTEAPEAPTGLAAQAAAGGHVELTWNDMADDELGFVVQRRKQNADGTWPAGWTVLTPAPRNAESYTDNTLTEAGSYRYRIQAYNSVGVSAWVGPVQVAATPPQPTDPSNVAIVAVNNSTDIRVTWQDGSTNETGFTLQRRRWVVAGTWSEWTTVVVTGPNVTQFLDDEVPVGSSYQYRVQAANAMGTSGWAVASGIRCEPTPLWPDNLKAHSLNGGQDIKLTWTDKSQKEDEQKVQRRQETGEDVWSDWAVVATLGANETEWTDDAVPGDGKYQYRVQAFCGGAASEFSPVLTVQRVATAAASSTLLSVAGMDVQQVNGQCASIVYNLSAAADVTVEVRNIAGRLVTALPPVTAAAGINTATWNLRNSSGAPIPSGTYLCTLRAMSSDGTQANAIRALRVQR